MDNIMQNIDLGSILIVSVLVSIIVQWLKSKLWSATAKKLLVVFLSVGSAGFYILFKDSAFWPTFVTILAFASTIYAFVIKDLFPKE